MELSKVAFDPTTWTEVDSAAAGTITVTRAAEVRRNHFIHFVLVSSDAAHTSPLTIQVLAGATVLAEFYMPAEATAPVMINFVRPLRAPENTAVSVTVDTVAAANVAVTLGGNSIVS